MSIIVQKFGGTSVADMDRIHHVAGLVKREVDLGNSVLVVVSAMAGETNKLVGWADDACQGENCDAREVDTVVSAGEQITAGLTALALQNLGVPARSFLGWQMLMMTDNYHGNARITDIQQSVLATTLGEGKVCVCAGFQGVNEHGRITTLGRGGSDTSAVALAAAMKADRCDIYTDVDGVYTSDPRMVKDARKLDVVTYEEMLEMASSGAKVLHPRCVMLALKQNMPLTVRSSFTKEGLEPGDGTPIVSMTTAKEDYGMEESTINGITVDKNVAQFTLKGLPDRPGVAMQVFAPIAEANVDVDIISQATSADREHTSITFTVALTDFDMAKATLEKTQKEVGFDNMESRDDVAKVSVVGVGVRGHAGISAKMFRALSENSINIHAIASTEIKVSVVVDKEAVETAANCLHEAFNLA